MCLCAAGIILIILGWGIFHRADLISTGQSAGGDPSALMGKSWRPEEIEQVHAEGLSHFSIPEHVPHLERLDDTSVVTVIERGHVGYVQAQTINLSKGRAAYPVYGAPWGEKSQCLVWQFQGLQLDKNDDFGGIELEITDRRNEEHSFHISFLSRTASVPIVLGERMKYVIVPDMAVGPHDTRVLDNRKSLDVVFPDIKDRGEVALHSISIISKVAGYTDGPKGHAYETLDQETRPVLYQWTDGLLSWTVDLPVDNPVLKFGTGLLPRSTPVTFSIKVACNDIEQQVFSTIIQRGDTWTDHSIDLSAWQGKHTSISFRVYAPSPSLALWSSPRVVESEHRGKLFCLYVVDALRADACEGFGTFDGQVNVTPAIRGLSREGVSCTNAIANAPITKYSLASLLSGLHPSHSGMMKYQRLPDGIITLPEIFRQNGFVTASFIFNSNAGKLRGLHQGYDYLYSLERISREAKKMRGKNSQDIYGINPALTSAGMITDFLFNFIRRHQEEDLFLYLHLMDTHAPYVPDEEFLEEFYELMSQRGIAVPRDHGLLLEELKYTQKPNYSPRQHLSEEALLALYRGAARTADKHLQRFMDFLRSEGRDADTTLVFTSDHGEHLNEHPDLMRFTHMHPMLLEVLRIPLIIYAPAILPGGTVISKPVQLTDVMPTLLDLAGISYEASQFDGVSLLALAAGEEYELFSKRPMVSQSSPHWSVMLGDIHCPDITRGYNVVVYNIAQDPREHRPLKDGSSHKALDALLGSLAMIPQRTVPGADTIITNELALKQLKDLGYIQ